MPKITRPSICSFNNKKDKRGTKTYPNDSSIAISFSWIPLLIAQMLINREPRNMTYAKITRGLTIVYMCDLFAVIALFFNKS